MQNSDTSGLQVIKKEEKEPRVTAFIQNHLDRRAQARNVEPAEYLLIARSPCSPVCRALASLASSLAAHNITVRAVFTTIEASASAAEPGNRAGLFQPAAARAIDDVRLFEAHEQLVLDSETCWIGDCMRREPIKRDAYEWYSNASEERALTATRAFANLWQISSPAGPVLQLTPSLAIQDGSPADVLTGALTGEDKTPPTASTRH
ncbi:MAG: hypothetical protein ACERJ2_13750 [Filomicrobium sp.]